MKNFGKPLTSLMDNVLASKLGRIARKVADTPRKYIGDDIDRGLVLRRCLEEEGFYIVRLTRSAEQRNEPVTPIPAARYCSECKALLEDRSVYCDVCGTDAPLP